MTEIYAHTGLTWFAAAGNSYKFNSFAKGIKTVRIESLGTKTNLYLLQSQKDKKYL